MPRSPKGISYIDPLHAGRHPFQTYLLLLCIIAGVPILFGRIGASSIESELPFWLAFIWALLLFLGSAVGLVGAYWRGDYTNALTIERIGLAIVGSAACVYAVVIIVNTGWDRLIPAAITLAFGVASLRRARDIGQIIKMALEDLRVEVVDEGLDIAE